MSYPAPDGAIWVCAACGKTSRDRWKGAPGSWWDESCFLNAVLCYDDATLIRNEGGRVTGAKAFPPAETDP